LTADLGLHRSERAEPGNKGRKQRDTHSDRPFFDQSK
jgi:hypothetical protein